MAEALTSLLQVAHVAIISGGDWPQFEKQIAARLPPHITSSAFGQEAPLTEKEKCDPDSAKRKVIQADLRKRLPDMSINMGGATSVDITKKGVDKAYGLRRLSELSKIALEEIMFIGDAIFPGGNDYPAFELGLKTVKVKNPDGTLAAIAGIVACLS
ncbi:Eukaryotic phosphomannomutase [Penicillium expansum]|uniref:Eukaryotic phosphomannomutase n=1 Tax=Penicillium expansum TaxID=27334 RepID=A0A0A2JH80_PENEN|nr:Eukaryotic phosphomannomutase [Penicillium expansum]KGO47516.1 Eukaryotic phosphomannomutase [Penicillium expansum]KGO54757.1 Eukaryotic phosphomannomutase [Penicillium expansum]KGO69610.1 Eukaryotic phosphomannomutase [Penicillium expansum]